MSLTKTKIINAFVFAAVSAAPVLAQDGSGEGAPAPGGLFGGSGLLPMMIAMFAIIYFLMIRPEQKKQKQRQALLMALKKGDRVVTVGGIIGVITAVKDTSYIVKSGEGTLEFTRSAVSSVLNGADAQAADGKESK